MRKAQTHTPKYWVVHDKHDSDVLLFTARKSKENSIGAYVYSLKEKHPYWQKSHLESLYYDNLNLECVLVEINIVEEGK